MSNLAQKPFSVLALVISSQQYSPHPRFLLYDYPLIDTFPSFFNNFSFFPRYMKKNLYCTSSHYLSTCCHTTNVSCRSQRSQSRVTPLFVSQWWVSIWSQGKHGKKEASCVMGRRDKEQSHPSSSHSQRPTPTTELHLLKHLPPVNSPFKLGSHKWLSASLRAESWTFLHLPKTPPLNTVALGSYL